MNYYYIDKTILQSKITLNASNGYPQAVKLAKKQYDFALANPRATLEEILAKELAPKPAVVYIAPEPSLGERIEILENLELERILDA